MERTVTRSINQAPKLLLAGILLLPLLAGCEMGKQSAVLGIDEAKLAIASAQKVKADTYAETTLGKAQTSLRLAEKKFKNGAFVSAKREAETATQYARQAEAQAQQKGMEKKSRKRTKKA